MALLALIIKISFVGNVSWLKLIPSTLISFDSAGCQKYQASSVLDFLLEEMHSAFLFLGNIVHNLGVQYEHWT